MQSLLLLLSAVMTASHGLHSFDECYREGDLVLDPSSRCRYRQCARVEPEQGYAHYELQDKECPKGSGVPHYLLQGGHQHGVYAGHRFVGRHLASTVCSDKYVKDCHAYYGYRSQGYPHPLPIDPHSGYPPASKAAEEKKESKD